MPALTDSSTTAPTPRSHCRRGGHAPLALVLVLALALVPFACGEQTTEDQQLAPASTRAHLVWKRAHAVEQDLARALALEPEELCTELATISCTRSAHLISLGGHNPYTKGIFEPVAEPLVTTPLALDRVVLSACGERVERDRSGEAELFSALDLDGEAPSADEPAFGETVEALYRRLLARDPLTEELAVLAELLVDDDGEPVSASRFAHLACFIIATTTEFSFI